MRLVVAAALVAALVLSGCASNDPPTADSLVDGQPGVPGTGTTVVDEPVRLRFASGDYEGMAAGEASWGPADVCFPTCPASALKTFDLTAIIPADAPVELTVTIDGTAFGTLEGTDASVLQQDSGDEDDGTGENDFSNVLSALVVRAESGTVTLTLRSFSFPPDPQGNSATWEARSAIRADVLVPFVPALLTLSPGQQLNLTSPNVEEAILIAPDGRVERVQSAPFVVTANATGPHVLLMLGEDVSQVLGPNGTVLRAKRIAHQMGEPHALTTGQEATWSFDAPGIPVYAGIEISTVNNAGFFGVGSTIQSYAATLTSPNNVVVLDESGDCSGPNGGCGGFSLIGGFSMGFGTDFLDEYLVPGSYTAAVTVQGNNLQATEFVAYIA